MTEEETGEQEKEVEAHLTGPRGRCDMLLPDIVTLTPSSLSCLLLSRSCLRSPGARTGCDITSSINLKDPWSIQALHHNYRGPFKMPLQSGRGVFTCRGPSLENRGSSSSSREFIFKLKPLQKRKRQKQQLSQRSEVQMKTFQIHS